MRKVTENEKMVFEFIKDHIEEGYPPTVREICAEFGFKSTSTAHRYINNKAHRRQRHEDPPCGNCHRRYPYHCH